MAQMISIATVNKTAYTPPSIVDYGSVTALTQALPAMALIITGGLVTASVVAVVL